METPQFRALVVESASASFGPLLERRPFGLLPLGSASILHALFESLASAGCTEVDLMLEHLPAQTRAAVGGGARWGLAVRCHSVRDPQAWLADESRAARFLGGKGLLLSMALVPAAEDLRALAGISTNGVARLVRADGDALPAAYITEIGGPVTAVPAQSVELIDTPKALWAANAARLQRLDATPHPERRFGEDIYLGYRARFDETLEFRGPCLVGDGALIGRNCVVGERSLLGRGVVLDEGCEITRSLVLEGTYVGPHCLLSNKIADGSVLVDIESAAATYIGDPSILGTVSQFRSANASLAVALEWLLALLTALAVSLPLLAWALVRRARGLRAFERETRFIPTQRDLSGKLLFDEVPLYSLSGVQHPSWRRLPWLLQVLANRLRLVGAQEPLPRPQWSNTALEGVHAVISCAEPAAAGGNTEDARRELLLAAGAALSLRAWSRWLAGLFFFPNPKESTSV